ncbi:MAG: hypothetical protein MI750_06855, partial [Xanthomonadales bacterium]|nr:hypothetical protein [Xanthomonadales bacterium]
ETLKRSRQTTRIIDLEGSNSIFLTNMTAGQVSFQRLDGTIEIIDNVSGKTIVTSLMNGTSAYHFSDGSFNSEDISHLIQ